MSALSIERAAFEVMHNRGDFAHLGKPIAVAKGSITERRQYRNMLLIIREPAIWSPLR